MSSGRLAAPQWLRRIPAWTLPALIGVAGLGARLWLSGASLGSNDAKYWLMFAQTIRAKGVTECYRTTWFFNHPPLMGYWAAAALAISSGLGLRFEVIFRLLPIGADVVSGALLYRAGQTPRQRLGALALFAASPVALLVSAYHANTDPLLGALVLWASLQMTRQRPFAAGAALAAALNVKVLAVLFVPGLLLTIGARRALLRFAAGLAIGVLPFLPFVLGAWAVFSRNVLEYRSVPNRWGVNVFIELAGMTRHLDDIAKALREFAASYGRWLPLGAAVVLAVIARLCRVRDAVAIAAATVTWFLILTTGFGVQYLGMATPLLVAAVPAEAAVFSLTAGLYLVATYVGLWTGTRPFYSHFGDGYPALDWALAPVVWTTLVYAGWRQVRAWPGGRARAL